MSGNLISRSLAVAILGLIAWQHRQSLHRSVDVEAYHARIRDAAERVPRQIGPWVGQDVQVPVRALSVLRPNVMISRRYVNVETGQSAGVMLVHCADAHHMVGHFPLRCYQADGWTVKDARPHDWVVDGLTMTGTQYEFQKEASLAVDRGEGVVVANCLLRPGGKVLRDMTGMSESIVGAEGQASGAGQFQVYFDAGVPPAERDRIVTSLLAGCRPLIDAILADPKAASDPAKGVAAVGGVK